MALVYLLILRMYLGGPTFELGGPTFESRVGLFSGEGSSTRLLRHARVYRDYTTILYTEHNNYVICSITAKADLPTGGRKSIE